MLGKTVVIISGKWNNNLKTVAPAVVLQRETKLKTLQCCAAENQCHLRSNNRGVTYSSPSACPRIEKHKNYTNQNSQQPSLH